MSEFGRGIVVCLAKFSEHLLEHGPYSERAIGELDRWTAQEETRCRVEAARFPHGDAARKLERMRCLMLVESERDRAISHAIEMWMNGASDHFYDLDDRAPEPLHNLADLCLKIGHGFSGEQWTMKHVERIRELWQESCLAVDRMLGVDPDWGEW